MVVDVAVAPGVRRIAVPLPLALKIVNAYLVEGATGWALIDTGLHTEDGERALRAGVQAAGIDLADVRPDLHLTITYSLRSLDDREARLELDGSGEIAETPILGRGHNKLHGSANLTGAMSVDPRDGFAGTYRDELHVFYTVRDEENHPRGPAVNLIYVTETTISRAP